MPSAPVPIDAAPSVPTSAAPEVDFDAAYESFNKWEAEKLQPQANALAATTYINAVDAVGASGAAVTAANNAASAAEVAMGATNFKGMWAAQTGQLLKPATVKHNGRFWLLLANLADVTASEPTTSNPVWTTLDSSAGITQQIALSTTAIAGVTYIITAPGVTLTGPAAGSMAKGEGWGYVLTAAARTCYLNFANVPYRKRATGVAAWTIDSDVSGKWFQYEDTTQGYI